jgi:hypothetical protein
MDSPLGGPLLLLGPARLCPWEITEGAVVTEGSMLAEGWYLMSPAELEAELPHLNDPDRPGPMSPAVALDREEALAFKRAGNIPDALGRWLRLVLRVDGSDPEEVARRRMVFEPDYHDAPTWRRPGSKPVNVIPVRVSRSEPQLEDWRDDPSVAALEQEWLESGTMAGVKVPGEYRSFVHKTVLALQAAQKEVTADSISDSIARWVGPEDARAIRAALKDMNA